MVNENGAHVVAIIPARGGSKSIVRKNLAEVGGITLVGRAVRAALTSGVVDRVIVSTDDDEIAAVAIEAGAEAIARPPELGTDDARSIDVVLHVIETLGIEPDTAIVMLQPTSPFTAGTDVAGALSLFRGGSVISVTGTDHHPLKACLVVDGLLHPVSSVEDLEAPRQELPDAVRPNGAIYIASASDLSEHHRFFIDPVVPYTMSPNASIDIDTPEDLARANQLAD